MLQIDNLVKRYENNSGFGPVSISIGKGQVFAFVGPNGAGKTTFFNLLSGVLEQDGGSWSLNDTNSEDISRNRLGYLPETPFSFPAFSPRQFCSFDAAMRRIKCSESDIEKHLQAFGCNDYLDTRIEKLSMGMAKRVLITCAFLGDPDLILLDEPLNAIDIETTIKLKSRIADERAKGRIILISSHILGFLDEIADRIAFIDRGKLREIVDPKEQHVEEAYKDLFLKKPTQNGLLNRSDASSESPPSDFL